MSQLYEATEELTSIDLVVVHEENGEDLPVGAVHGRVVVLPHCKEWTRGGATDCHTAPRSCPPSPWSSHVREELNIEELLR